MRPLVHGCIWMWLAAAPALAQAGEAPLTADAAAAMAVQRNPRLAAAAHDIAAAQAGVRAARALVNPEIAFVPTITAGGSDEELLLQQRLELNGTRSARSRVAQAQLRRAQAEALALLRDLVLETKTAYYELVRARELHAQAKDLLAIAEDLDRSARRQVELGARPGIEQTQTAIEATRARQQVALADGRAEAALAALNTLMGRAPDEPIASLAPLTFTPETVDVDAAVQRALASRAEIAAVEAARDAFSHEARLARAEGRPDLAPQFRAETLTRGFESGLALVITLPLLDHGSRRGRVRHAEESAQAQEQRVGAARSQVRQEVLSVLARLRASEAVVKAFQGGLLDQARRVAEASRVGLRTGASTILAVLDAQRTYRSVLADYANALVDHAIARAELERALGSVPASLLPAPAAGTRRTTR